jgi:hypothetical protein
MTSPRRTTSRIHDGTRLSRGGVGARPLRKGGHDRRHVLAGEGPFAIERAVERDAEAELIAARRRRLARELLGRHVRRRAAHPRDRRVAGVFGRRHRGRTARIADGALEAAREPEVADAHAAVAADEHVGGLEVAVDESGGVGGGEAASRVDEAIDALSPRAFAVAEPLRQRGAVDELHGDEGAAVDHAGVEHGDHVGMLQPRHRLRLAPQPRLVAHGVGAQDLDGDLAVELRIVRGVDDAHAAFAEPIEEEIAAEGGAARRARRRRCRRRPTVGDGLAELVPLPVVFHRQPFFSSTMPNILTQRRT